MTPRMSSVLVLTAAALVGAEAAAQSPRRVAFRAQADVPEEGLRLRVMPEARPVGMPPPRIHTYRNPAGETFEMMAPRDHWFAAQFRGRWEDRDGARLTLAAVGPMLPERWPRPHVLAEEFRQAMAEARPPERPEEWRAWAEAWAGAQMEGPPSNLSPTPRVAQARLFTYAGDRPLRRGVAFRVRPNAFGVDPDRWFFVLLEFPGRVDVRTLEMEIPRSLLGGIAAVARPTAPPPGAAPDAAGADGASAALQASRQRAIDSIRGLPGWSVSETPHYVLVSDLTGSRARVIDQFRGDLEPLRAAFEALAPPVGPIQAVSVIRLFADGDDYARYVGPDHAWTGGAWIPARGELVVRPRDWGNLREQRAWILQTIYHEAFHQYLHYAMRGRIPGVWYNEGHATFFEGAEVRNDRVTFDEEPRHAAAFERLVREGRLEFARLLSMSYPDFYRGGGTDRGRSENYGRAWGLTYYLLKHPGDRAPHVFGDVADRYLAEFARTGDNGRAVAAALGDRTVEQLEAAVTAFWTSPTARRAARRFDPLEGRD